MSEWNAVQRAFAVETFFKSGESYTKTMRAFCRNFKISPRKPIPSRNTLKLWVHNFREKGSVLKSKHPGQQRSTRTPENIECVRSALQKSPGRSHRKHAASLDMKASTVRCILHDDLNFHPYKILMTQELLPTDPTARLNFSQRLLLAIEENGDFFLWGFLKSKVYVDKPRDLEHLLANIQREIRAITPAAWQKVIANFKKRLENCVKNRSGHLSDVIFKTK